MKSALQKVGISNGQISDLHWIWIMKKFDLSIVNEIRLDRISAVYAEMQLLLESDQWMIWIADRPSKADDISGDPNV